MSGSESQHSGRELWPAVSALFMLDMLVRRDAPAIFAFLACLGGRRAAPPLKSPRGKVRSGLAIRSKAR